MKIIVVEVRQKMNDYISRQAAIDEIKKCRFIVDAIENIRGLPTADVRENVRGEWKLDPNGMDWNIPAYRCSECGFVANYIGVEANGLGNNPMNWAGSNFCPNCGAQMRGDKT